MVGEAITEARDVIGNDFGENYLPKSPRVFKSKAKNAQEAHEAIRPTSFKRHPSKLGLTGDQQKLYELIWKRAMASQMENARMERTTIEIGDSANTVGLRATGSVIRFDGFLKLYEVAPSAADKEKDEDDAGLLPAVSQGDNATAKDVETTQHFCLLYTSPSPRDQRGSRMPSSA